MTDRRAAYRGPDRRQSERRAPDLPAIILRVALDPNLRPRDVHVYLALFQDLDVLTFLPVKHLRIAKKVRLSRGFIHTSLKRLVERGYLEVGAAITTGVIRTYRLTSRFVDVIPKDLEAEALREALREISQLATDKAFKANGHHRRDLEELGQHCLWAARHSEIREAAA